MSEMNWELLVEVQGRFEAEALKAFLEAEGLPVQLIQEGAGEFVYPVTVGPLGRVQVFVPKDKLQDGHLLREAFYAGEADVELAEPDDDELDEVNPE